MANVYELGDLLVTREYEGERVEVCVYKAQTGSLFLCLTSTLIYHKERFVKNHDSMPHCTRVIRAENAAEYLTDNLSNQA